MAGEGHADGSAHIWASRVRLPHELDAFAHDRSPDTAGEAAKPNEEKAENVGRIAAEDTASAAKAKEGEEEATEEGPWRRNVVASEAKVHVDVVAEGYALSLVTGSGDEATVWIGETPETCLALRAQQSVKQTRASQPVGDAGHLHRPAML